MPILYGWKGLNKATRQQQYWVTPISQGYGRRRLFCRVNLVVVVIVVVVVVVVVVDEVHGLALTQPRRR